MTFKVTLCFCRASFVVTTAGHESYKSAKAGPHGDALNTATERTGSQKTAHKGRTRGARATLWRRLAGRGQRYDVDQTA
jgi:hypothetical protein